MHVIRAGDPEFLSLWRELTSSSFQQGLALYGDANLAYYREYLGGNEIADCSFLVVEGVSPAAGMSMFLCKRQSGGSELSCYGLPVLYLESSEIVPTVRSGVHKLLKGELLGLFDSPNGPDSLLYRDQLNGGELSYPGRILLDRGASAILGFTQIIDLASSDNELHRSMTKAFKWGVNWGMKNLALIVLDSSNISNEHMEAFRLLHVNAAGRETRSRRSWELQHAMVMAHEAFCVLGWFEERLVTAALFPHSSAHCFYGVSASRRDLFDKPLSHAVIWTALQHAKKIGIKKFELGEQLFPAIGDRRATAKELGISFFKRAFGGCTKAHIDIHLAKCEAEKIPSALVEPYAS